MKKKTLAILGITVFACFFLDNAVSELFLAIRNPLLDKIMGWFSHEITVFVVLVVISSLFLYEERKNRFIPALFMSFFTGLIVSFLLKLAVMRVRPDGISYLALSVLGLAVKVPDYSFPSMHSAMAFSVLPVLDREFKKVKYFWIFFSVMIALSRIYLNQHYLSDVVTGGLIGYIAGEHILKAGDKHAVHKSILQHI